MLMSTHVYFTNANILMWYNHDKCKHIDVIFYFQRNLIRDGMIELSHCNSKEQLVDVMAKPKQNSFCILRPRVGVCNLVEIK